MLAKIKAFDSFQILDCDRCLLKGCQFVLNLALWWLTSKLLTAISIDLISEMLF